jgi:hypothetical protein
MASVRLFTRSPCRHRQLHGSDCTAAGSQRIPATTHLVYSTGNGNGPFGLGLSLSIPGVSRKTSRGIPRYGDERGPLTERDTFLLSGAEDFVPVAETTGGTRYRPRTEGLFARIEHHREVKSGSAREE